MPEASVTPPVPARWQHGVMMRRRLPIVGLAAAAFVSLVALLGACAPATGSAAGPAVAVLNGPTQGRIAGSAALLQDDMAQQGALHFHFVNSAAMRFAEGHNDFYHDRAVTAAGRVARSYGAPYAVLIGASTLDRKVTTSHDGGARSVDVTVQMEAVVVDASTDQAVSRIDSQVYEQTRYESTDTALPPLQRDPTVQTLRDQGVGDIAPAVLGAVWNALGIHPTRPGG